MSLPSRDLDQFYRFFRIAGMDHCSGGLGAWQIGQNGESVLGVQQDAQHNILLRMVDWVEKGDAYAPETVTGTKFINDTVSLGVDFKPEAWKCVL
ncbi:tannase protein [Taxawa tesnikishii (nom. ined.)]|nr:tannase protein [Dothideales sp. JES 119]